MEKKLGPKGTPPGLVANIPKGMRAFAIDVTEQSGVSGFILPGHRVDVIRHDASDKNELRAETILQNVLVLAAGQVFTRPEERDGPVADGDPGAQARRKSTSWSRPAREERSRSRCAASTTTTWWRDRRPSRRSTPNTRSG